MNDEAARARINMMVRFINQEAREKVEEIRQRAEMEAGQVQNQYVIDEMEKLEREYTRKTEVAEGQRKVATSAAYNGARLRALQAQNDVLDELVKEARGKLVELTRDAERYGKLLTELLAQCFLALENEKTVTVQCRADDDAAVRAAIPDAAKIFQEKTGAAVKAEIDSAHRLTDEDIGGVLVVSADGAVVCPNTLSERLSIAVEKELGRIRKELFPEPRRKSARTEVISSLQN